MSMRRNSITVNESGNIIMPENVSNIWMSEPELVELFGVIAPTLRSAIRNIYNSGALKEYEVQKYVRQENGYHADVFSFPMIVALAFRIDSFGAEQVRNAIFKRLYSFRQQASEPSFQHLEVGELTHPALLRYLQERGINIALAKAQCKELHFTHNGKPYFAIGFPNVAGGFEVRNRFFKGCVAPKDISHIRQQGEAREKCLVFEGMMDYLSFLTLRKRNCSNLPDLDRQDYVILNSTANVSKAIDVLHGYGRIHCMLDNDEAGRKAYRELERKFAGRIRDFSDNYKGHKDLNDYLRGIRQKLAVSPPLRTIVKPKKKGLGL